MVNPPAIALKRRAIALEAAAVRELAYNEDTAALLLFYAAECALKYAYMMSNNLKSVEETRASAASARSFNHNLEGLVAALRIPKVSIGSPPQTRLVRTGVVVGISALHQAWRYGEKVADVQAIYDWLNKLVEWCRKTS